MLAYFCHNNAYDTIIIPETRTVLTVDKELFVEFLTPGDPHFENWSSYEECDADIPLDTKEDCEAYAGTVVASRGVTAFTCYDEERWNERIAFYREQFPLKLQD